ncbi:hypothetical protein EWE75_07460 [Sphingomonas populi]|uniref:Uncharacterized protein n=1 Tax=Sphingomonas populi TaxID=2484750 RepID=A0A4Q6Y6S1_9SPHN|nr:hypothetical protein [Sphingomonas populi]RZF65197.1 hypothetical protein EWE75_07460 [Sphingomonas populi]
MHQAHIDTDHAEAVFFAAAMFTPLERTVLELARSERGTGLLPTSGFRLFLERVSFRLFGRERIRPLADPRLEALRSFVNALHRCSRARVEATADALRSVGFDPLQEAWIRSTFARCA